MDSILIVLLFIFVFCLIQTIKSKKIRFQLLSIQEERKRLRGCAIVENFFKNNAHYLLDQSIDQSELKMHIKQGISPWDLKDEIVARFKELNGLKLGYQTIFERIKTNKGEQIKGYKFDIILTPFYRDQKDIYIVGKKRTGKTTLMNNLIFQDLTARRGVVILCHERDQVLDVLSMVPPERMDDLIYQVPFNPLHLNAGENLDLKINETLTIFKRIVAETSSQMDEILKHSLYVLIKTPGTTILDFDKLLDRNNPKYRMNLINKLEPEEKKFWLKDYPQYSKSSHLPLMHRIGMLVGLPGSPMRNMLCNPHSKFSFRQAMDSGKILLFDLSDGKLGPENARILGNFIIINCQLALMSRADSQVRPMIYFYIDEVHQYLEPESMKILISRGGKYNCSFCFAHQQISQLPGEIIKEILGNVTTIVSFAVSYEDAVKLSREFININSDGEIVNIPPERFLNLKRGEVLYKIDNYASFMKTEPFKRPRGDEYIQLVTEHARQNWGVKVEEQLVDLEKINLNESNIFDRLKPEKVFDDTTN